MTTTQQTAPPAPLGRTDLWAAATKAWTDYVDTVGELGRRPPAVLGAPTAVLAGWVDLTERMLTANLEFWLKLASVAYPSAETYPTDGAAEVERADAEAAAAKAAAAEAEAAEKAAAAAAAKAAEKAEREKAELAKAAADKAEAGEAEREGAARKKAAADKAEAGEAEREEAARNKAAADEAAAAKVAADEAERDDTVKPRGSYSRMRKAELVAELARRGLPQDGRVTDLVARLVSADADTN